MELNTLVDIWRESLLQYAPEPVLGTKVRTAAGQSTYQWITYGELGRQIEKARTALAALGLKPGERVGIISANRVEWAATAYAAYELGGVIVPMYESQSPAEWGYIIRDAEPAVLAVSTGRLFRKLQSALPECPSVRNIVLFEGGGGETESYAEWMQRAATLTPAPAVKASQLADLIYTSGTTGRPKGVMLSHGNFTSNLNAVRHLFPLGPGDVSLSFLPWAHAFGQTVELHGLISMGAAMGLAERVDTILENLAEVKPTMLVSVPRIFNRIYEGLHQKIEEEGGAKKRLFDAGLANTARLRRKQAAGTDGIWDRLSNQVFDRLVFSKVRARFGGRMKYAFSGGAALAPDVAEFIDHLNIRVFEGYGLTETSPIMTANYPGNRKIGSVGKPIAGVTVRLDTSKGTGVPGEGEIINYGPNTMLGYYKLPKETAETLQADGGLRTGDLGYFDADGFLFVTGRVKDLYKLENGKYVSPVPLEEELQLSPYILQAMLYGANLPANIALIVPQIEGLRRYAQDHGLNIGNTLAEMNRDPEVQALLRGEVAKLSARWRGYERPRQVMLADEEWTLDNDLLTPTLKIKRRNVVAKYKDRLLGGQPSISHEAPEASAEQERPARVEPPDSRRE